MSKAENKSKAEKTFVVGEVVKVGKPNAVQKILYKAGRKILGG